MTSVDERETPQSQSELEEAYSDSDYSPGSLMIDIGADDAPSSVPSSPPSAAVLSSPTTNRGRRSSARRRYNTESNRVEFNGVRLLGQMEVVQAGHPKPLDTIYLYAYGWGDFFLDVIARHNDSIIPVKNLYEKVIPGLKRNVLSARISKLQVKSEALMEPYITALKKLGLVVTGASHFVGIVDFIKICKYFKTPPPDNLTKFYAISSEVNPDDVLRSFSAERGDLQVQSIQMSPMFSSTIVDPVAGGSGASCGVMDVIGDLSPPSGGEVDIRRVVLPGGKQLAVVVRNGEAYILKVELAKILPSHSRDVLETIRRTYSIAVHHANKMEISALKCMGAVGGKAGRSALFSASDVCRMFEHWKARAPLVLRQLAEGKLPEDKVDGTLPSSSLAQQHIPTSSAALPPYPISPFDFSADHLQPSLSPFDITSQTPFHPPSPLDLPSYNSPQHLQNPQQTPTLSANTFTPPLSQSFVAAPLPPAAPPLSHPPSTLPTSTSFVGSSLTPDRLQQPIQLLNSLQQSSISPTPPPPHYSTSAQPPPHYATFPPPSHPSQPLSSGEQKGKSSPFMSPSGTKLELGTRSGTPLRRRSSSGPPLDDQGLEYSTLTWGDETMTLVCPVGGEEPYLAIPELVNKIFHNRSFVSPQQRSELGIVTIPATSLQVYALRAKGSIDNYTGNIKLIAISGAVKLAAVSNIQIPGTVIQALKKYCKEPLESLITPVGFAPATRPPSIQSSRSQHPRSSGLTEPSRSQPRSTKGGKTVPESPTADATSLNDDSAANVWPSKGVPEHPDVIDPGPYFTNTADGTYCLVNWGKDRLAVLISSQKVHYMGLYQVFHTLFKQYVTRMNFKMRMRKLEIKSIRASSNIRQMLINLDALPQSSPVCGLVRVSEVERLARSYGVEPPQVLYDVFLLRHSNQQKLPNSARPVTQSDSSRKALVRKAHGSARVSRGEGMSTETPPTTETYHEAKEMQSLLQQASQMMPLQHPSGAFDPSSSTAQQVQYRDTHMLAPTHSSSSTSSAPYFLTTMSHHSSQMPSTVFTTATTDKDALLVSVPRNLLTSHFRLVSRPVAPPAIMASLHSHSSSSSAPPFRGSMLQSLAKKISQKSRKLGKAGAGSTRHCPKCHRVNPPAKKRCTYCEEFLVGRACPACGTLNHNRTRECFKCKATIAIGSPGGQAPEGHAASLPFPYQSYVKSPSNQQGNDGLVPGFFTSGSPSNDGDQSTSPKSPLSPCFSAPPIRHAALKSMFPQEAPKGEETHVITKTMYSGNLSSSRKCIECGQLNSKMAKKCLQCRSPLQGRSCPKCGRPNHNHSPECYKCGHQLPSTATKWVYVGSHSGRAYKAQDSTISGRSSSLKYRAPISCLRCERLRNNGRFVCGRCGDMYWTKPVVPAPGEEAEGVHQHSGHGKKKKGISEPNWNIPSEQDPEMLQLFAQNLLTLDIGDQLLTVVNEAESYARERVYKAEEELEGVEEEYQTAARKREQSENVLNDARAELSALIAEVERQQQKLTRLSERQEEAKCIVETYPDKISHLKEKIDSALHLFTPATPQNDSMDCSH